jgi:hypothetical protein
VYINLHSYPGFSPDAVREIDLSRIPAGDRNLDILTANSAMREVDDPLWRGLAAGATPDRYVWHHVERTRTLALIPRKVHMAVRHAGGIAAPGP